MSFWNAAETTEEEVDVECPDCDGQGIIEEADRERSCLGCGGTGQKTVHKPQTKGN